MATFLTLLYLLAAGLSLWGVIGPYRAAKRHQGRAERARALKRDLTKKTYSDDPEVSRAAREQLRAALPKPFEGGPETFEDLSVSWVMMGGSAASTARDVAQSRSAGLPWVVAGVVVGSLASALSIWLLP